MRILQILSRGVAPLALLTLTACSHTLTVQDKEKFEAEVDGLAFSPAKKLPPSTKQRLPLKAGQWVIFETTFKDSSGKVTQMSYSKDKVVALEGDTVTFEIETHSAGRPDAVTQAIVVDHFPTAKQLSWSKDEAAKVVDQMQIKRIVTKIGNRKPTEVPLNLVPVTKSLMKDFVGSSYRLGPVTAEVCATDTLSSARCFAFDYAVDLPGWTKKGRVDVHSAIPVVGYVTQKGDDYESHVVAFGLTGAKGTLITAEE